MPRPTDTVDPRAAAQEQAQAAITASEQERLAAERAAAEEEQRRTEHKAAINAPATDGPSVQLRYLGTSDRFVVRGAGADGADLVAEAGGDPITVSAEQAEWYTTHLTHDRFEIVNPTPQENGE